MPVARPSPVTIGMLFALGVSFALAISLNRFAVDDGVPFQAYVFWQSLGGGVALMLMAAALRRLPPIDFRHVRIFLTTGALNLSFPYMLLAYLAAKVPASLLTLGAFAGSGDDLRTGAHPQARSLPCAPFRRHSAGARRHPRGAPAAGEPAGAGHGRLGGARPAALALLRGQRRTGCALAPAGDGLAAACRRASCWHRPATCSS